MKKPTYNFLHRLQLAISGIYVAFVRERHMKAHLLWGTGLLLPLTFIEVKITHRFILILLLANVIVIELINTAIETTIDLVTRRYSYRAKLAKDMASGAVLLASLMLLGFSIFIYWPAMYNFFKGVLIGS